MADQQRGPGSINGQIYASLAGRGYSLLLCLYRPKHHRASAAKQRSNTANALAFLEMQPCGLRALICLEGMASSQVHATIFRRRDPSQDAIPDQVSLEFRHMRCTAYCRGCGVRCYAESIAGSRTNGGVIH